MEKLKLQRRIDLSTVTELVRLIARSQFEIFSLFDDEFSNRDKSSSPMKSEEW